MAERVVDVFEDVEVVHRPGARRAVALRLGDVAVELLLEAAAVEEARERVVVDEVLEALKAKPPDLHLIVTGRNAAPELVALADLVTEMTLVKHPFRSGVKAQQGIEF